MAIPQTDGGRTASASKLAADSAFVTRIIRTELDRAPSRAAVATSATLALI